MSKEGRSHRPRSRKREAPGGPDAGGPLDPPKSVPSGAWAEKRRLAGALRKLISLCVTTDAPEDRLREAADTVERSTKLLASHKGPTALQAFTEGTYADNPAAFGDRSAITGLSNPLSPPVTLHMEGDAAVGLSTFGEAYEGAPGVLHGGYVSATLDQIFGYLMAQLGSPSMTGSLTVRYLKPTPIRKELRFEASIRRKEGRKTYLEGRVLANGKVTAEADSVFVAVDVEHMEKIFNEWVYTDDAKPKR